MNDPNLMDAFESLTSNPAASRHTTESIAPASRARVRRRRGGFAVGAGLVAAAVVGTVVVLGQSSGGSAAPPPVVSTPTAPALPCPTPEDSDSGPATVAPGAIAVRLCNAESQGLAPADVLITNPDAVVAAVNSRPRTTGGTPCFAPSGENYVLVFAYPRGATRQVFLRMEGCGGTILVGTSQRRDPDKPLQTFLDLVHQQRASSFPSAQPVAPTCMSPYQRYSPLADPADMVTARLCVSYQSGSTPVTSVSVTRKDVAAIIDDWTHGPTTPMTKGPDCDPITPQWVLSGVTKWGDRVQITAECNRPSRGENWVTFSPTTQAIIDRLVDQAGVQAEIRRTPTAWTVVNAWLSAVNLRATVSSEGAATMLGNIANDKWLGRPYLPDGELNWDLLPASKTTEPGWEQAYRVPARTSSGQAVFVVVRHASDQPWRILRLTQP